MNPERTTRPHDPTTQAAHAPERGSRTRLPAFVALAALAATGTLLLARANGNHGERHHLEGTWMGTGPGSPPGLITFLSEGSVIWSRPPTVVTGPDSYALVSTGHGEWVRTRNDQFVYTTYFLSGNTSAEFATLIKVTETATLNDASDAFTQTGTVSGYDPAGNLLFSFPGPVTTGTRIVAGE